MTVSLLLEVPSIQFSSSQIQSDSLPTNGDFQKSSIDERLSNLFSISSDTIHGISPINQLTSCDKNTKCFQQKRSLLSKYYTSVWIDSQISEEIPTGKLKYRSFLNSFISYYNIR